MGRPLHPLPYSISLRPLFHFLGSFLFTHQVQWFRKYPFAYIDSFSNSPVVSLYQNFPEIGSYVFRLVICEIMKPSSNNSIRATAARGGPTLPWTSSSTAARPWTWLGTRLRQQPPQTGGHRTTQPNNSSSSNSSSPPPTQDLMPQLRPPVSLIHMKAQEERLRQE